MGHMGLLEEEISARRQAGPSLSIPIKCPWLGFWSVHKWKDDKS